MLCKNTCEQITALGDALVLQAVELFEFAEYQLRDQFIVYAFFFTGFLLVSAYFGIFCQIFRSGWYYAI